MYFLDTAWGWERDGNFPHPAGTQEILFVTDRFQFMRALKETKSGDAWLANWIASGFEPSVYVNDGYIIILSEPAT